MPGGVRLRVRVQPRASANEVAGMYGDQLRIRLSAAPVDGAANDALTRFLAGLLGVAPGAVRLISGPTGRSKVVEVLGVNVDQARSRLIGPQTGR